MFLAPEHCSIFLFLPRIMTLPVGEEDRLNNFFVVTSHIVECASLGIEDYVNPNQLSAQNISKTLLEWKFFEALADDIGRHCNESSCACRYVDLGKFRLF